MAANVNAQLGLVITANDKASPIFEALARNIMSAFSSANTEARTLGETISNISAEANTRGASEAIAEVGNVAEASTGAARGLSDEFTHMAGIAALQDIGARFTNAGMAATSFFEGATGQGMTFDQTVKKIGVTLNSQITNGAKLSGQQIEALGQKAMDLSNKGYFTSNQLSEGMYVLARQGINYKDIMGGAMNSIQDLAKATDSNLSSTTNTVSDIIHEMGGELKDEFGSNVKDQMGGVADAISGAMHNARMSMTDFLGALKYVGPQASAMGMSITDVSTAVALLGEHGIKANQAGTTLRRMLTNLTAPTAAASKELNTLGIGVGKNSLLFDQSTGKIKSFGEIQAILSDKLKGLSIAQKEAALKTIFGQYALSGMNAIVDASSTDVKNLSAQITKHGEAQDLANGKMDNAAGQAQKLSNQYDNLKTQIGVGLIPVASQLMTSASGLLAWFNKLSPSTKTLIVRVAAIGGIATLVIGKLASFISSLQMMGVALKNIGNLAEGFKSMSKISGAITQVGGAFKTVGGIVVKGISGIGKAFSVFTEFLMANPIILIIAGLVLLGVALYELYQHSQTFRDGVNAVILAVVGCFKGLWQDIVNLCKGISKTWDDFWAGINTSWHSFKSSLSSEWNSFWNGIKTVGNAIWEVISGYISAQLAIIQGIFKVFGDILHGNWGAIWTDLKTAVTNVINDILGIFGSSADDLFNAGKNLMTNFANGIKSLMNAIKLPHLKISGSFSLNPPSMPKVGVDWYAKGGIFNSPQTIGVGESGSEAVLPLNKLSDILNLDKLTQGATGGKGKNQVNNITIQINGRGKNDKDLADDIARRIRLQMNVVSS